MHLVLRQAVEQAGFWAAWFIIPAFFELLKAMRAWGRNRFVPTEYPGYVYPGQMPRITILAPIFNSAGTLGQCLRSIANSTYPNELINVICANNQSMDNSRRVFQLLQDELSDLPMQWLETSHGKAQALNTAIYTSTGDYVVTLDSDATLEKHALMNVIRNFVTHPDMQAQTGIILINRKLMQSPGRFTKQHRFFHLNEYLEYMVTFLAGRTFESHRDQLFTMSGAFSAFRRSALMQSRLFNVNTVGEDTDITFQIRYNLNGQVVLCPSAVCYVEPAASWDDLYVQRQRWQRGEIEVVKNFFQDRLSLKAVGQNFLIRRLLVDHTMALLKGIWLVAPVIMLGVGISLPVILTVILMIYGLYLLIAIFNLSNVVQYLRFQPEEQRYVKRRWWLIFTLPVYDLMVSYFRLIGILNVTYRPAVWNTVSLSQENAAIQRIIRQDIQRFKDGLKKER